MTLRKKYILLALILILILLSLALLDSHSHAIPLRFSTGPGFYQEPFPLELISDFGYEIHYTMDGSEPTLDSRLYTEPILISDLSSKENRYACRDDISAGFRKDLIEQVAEKRPDEEVVLSNYAVPDYPVDKCSVVRATAFLDGEAVASLTGSYFVGFQQKHTYDTVKVVSLVTDPDNLFDYKTGIYVTGAALDQAIDKLGEEPEPGEESIPFEWAFWPANYQFRGRDWERPAYIQVFGEDRQLQLEDGCGIRTQGGVSRGYAQKNLSIFARREYSGKDTFSSSLFAEGTEPHKFLLFTGSNDNLFKLQDAIVSTLVQGLDFAAMTYTPCVLFLNGEFWGTYYLTESYNEKYIQDHYGVQPGNIIMIKSDEVEEGEPSGLDIYHEMVYFIGENDMTLRENYMKALEWMDMDSYTDYYAAEIYIGRYNDWPNLNEAAWRSKSIRLSSASDNFEDGKWRWMLFDVNGYGLTADLIYTDTLAETREVCAMFDSLCRNPDFQKLLAQKLRYMAQEVFTEEACQSYLNGYLETMLDPLCASNRRFYGEDCREEILQNVRNTADFFRQRADYVDTMIVTNFGEGI